jgi:hypothetical protein
MSWRPCRTGPIRRNRRRPIPRSCPWWTRTGTKPAASYTGWNIYKAPHPAGELADRDGTFLAFAATRAERETAGDPRLSIAERAPEAPRRREAAVALVRDRLLLAEDAAVWN